MSQLNALFDKIGRTGQWTGQKGNPVCSREVSIYRSQVREEQSIGHVAPIQAVPLFLPKVRLIALYINRKLDEGDKNSLSMRYIWARDQAWLKLMAFGGDRANDVGLMLSQEVKSLTDNSGFVIRHTWGKNIRVDKPNIFTILRCQDETICPVKGIDDYVRIAASLGINLKTGFLFRPTSHDKVINAPLSYDAIYERLDLYLTSLGIKEGETPHSLRSGCALSLQSAGIEKSSSMQHIGWASETSASHYARSSRVHQANIMRGIVTGPLTGYNSVDHIDHNRLEKTFK